MELGGSCLTVTIAGRCPLIATEPLHNTMCKEALHKRVSNHAGVQSEIMTKKTVHGRQTVVIADDSSA
jgi:hypothetical protein